MSLSKGWGAKSDRGLALALAALALEILIRMGAHDGVLPFITGVPIFGYLAALWYSRPWGLLAFGLLSFPMGFCAWVVCDMSPENWTGGLLHRVCTSPMWACLALYGIGRSVYVAVQQGKTSPPRTESVEWGGGVKP